jgi:hypothetical protein
MKKAWGQACVHDFMLWHTVSFSFLSSSLSTIFDNLDKTDKSLLSSACRSTSQHPNSRQTPMFRVSDSTGLLNSIEDLIH